MTFARKLGMVAALCAAGLLGSAPRAADYWMYVGGYTAGQGRGIYLFHYSPARGRITSAGLAVSTGNPSYLVVHPNHQVLFAANENGSETVMGSVSAFRINPKTGKLAPINWVSSKGGAPCHLALDHTAKWLAAANYSSGSVVILPVADDGTLGEASDFVQQAGSSANKERQSGPHAHQAVFSPDNKFLLVADLGADKIFVYRFDAAHGKITPNDPPSVSVKPGAGVRHMVFHPNGAFLYAANEMASSVTVFRYAAGPGVLEELQTVSTLPEGYSAPNTAAEIAINTDGTRLYVSNRGQDSLALFAIDPVTSVLSAMEFPPAMVKKPRFFTLDPDGANLIVAGQDSSSLQVFRVHPRTGQIQPTAPPTKSADPACVVFVPR